MRRIDKVGWWTGGMAVCLALAAARARAEDAPAIVLPAPFAAPPPAVSTGAAAVTLTAAQSAQDLGLPSVAANLYRKLLAEPAAANPPPGMDGESLTLALATALLDAGDAAEAQAALAKLPEPHRAAWHLRAGLAALAQKKRDVAQAEWDAINPDDLSLADHSWYYFLAGLLWDLVPNRDGPAIAKANQQYSNAKAGAVSDFARARFQLAADRTRLFMAGPPSPDVVEQARRNFEQNQGRQIGYDMAEIYATYLALTGQKGRAVEFLQRQVLLLLPPQQRELRDRFDFDLALIDNNGKGPGGRAALTDLLENGANPERQRQALTLLALASLVEPQRAQFRAELTKLLAAKQRHPIADALLFYRAQMALEDRDYAQAEKDALELKDQYSGSPLRAHAFGILTQSAWEQQRFRSAASNARDAVAAAPASALLRVDLGIIEAEALFRAGDYRQSADTYEAVVHARPAGLTKKQLGDLIFQRVLAEIDARSPDAAKVLDSYAQDPAFDLENRWRAEWFLARALQAQGGAQKAEALARVSRLLADQGPGAAALAPDLRAKMAWLEARLAFEADQFDKTEQLADALVGTPAELSPALRSDIASTALLLKARSQFARNQDAVALETLQKLRTGYGKTEAAIYSYVIQAARLAEQDKISEAQKVLTLLIDNKDYQKSEYVPWALYQSALLSEKLGQDKNLKDAAERLEDVVKHAAAGDLVFAARLKQGDLLRRLNQFPQAQQVYELLVNNYGQRPDVVYAQLALAECHSAQSSSDVPGQPSHAETAQLLFEHLRDRVNAPKDVRVEAGYNLGYLLERSGKRDEAATVWMRDVITPFLKEEKEAFAPDDLRPYWLGRTLISLGELLEKQGRIEEAKEAYQLVLRKSLSYGGGSARAALERLGVKTASL